MTDISEYRATAKAAGLENQDLAPVFTVRQTERYMAFSKNTPADVVAKWNAALESMKKDGAYDAIIKKWSEAP